MRRRRFLGTAGIVVWLGGCSEPADGTVVLERLIVANRDEERDHAIHVSVERNGGQVYERVHEFEAGEDVVAPADVVEEPFANDAGTYVVFAELRSDEESPIRIDVGGRTERECAIVTIEASRRGRLGGAVLEKCPSDTDWEAIRNPGP